MCWSQLLEAGGYPSGVSGPVPTELFLEVFLLKRHPVTVRWVEPGVMLFQDVRQVAERWVVPSAMFLQDFWPEPPLERGSVSWKRAPAISPG